MSVEAVARKDFRDAVRSRWLLGLAAVFVVIATGFMLIGAQFLSSSEAQTFSTSAILGFMNGGFTTLLVPLIALVVAYGAVVGERESGSLKLLLSLPHSRADVVAGKVIGRTAAVGVPLFVGFLVPALVAAVGPLQFAPLDYVGYLLLMVVLAAVYVSIAVGFSAATGSSTVAVAAAVGVYFLFTVVLGGINNALPFVLGLNGGPAWLPLTVSELQTLMQVLNPTGAFKIVSREFLSGTLFAPPSAGGQAFQQATELSAVLMLAVWLVVPPIAGLARFERTDL
ncbi:ABC transporter permease [Halobaculum sp. MBLA0143]|uniref:ABC transporter permease n=1 Tax=Halobaculum sp. MBLA0143 TaxID=3079933 RepID=UPI0035269CC0